MRYLIIIAILLASCKKPIQYECVTIKTDGNGNFETISTWYMEFYTEQEMKDYVQQVNANRQNGYLSYCTP